MLVTVSQGPKHAATHERMAEAKVLIMLAVNNLFPERDQNWSASHAGRDASKSKRQRNNSCKRGGGQAGQGSATPSVAIGGLLR